MSRDVLFYTLAVSAAVATIFWVWLLWYIIRIFKNVEGLVEDFRDRLHAIDGILRTIEDKLNSTHLQLTVLSTGLKELLGWFMNRRTQRRTSTRASKTEDDF